MVGRPKKENDFSEFQATESEVQITEPVVQKSEPQTKTSGLQIQKTELQSGLKVTRIEGFLTDVQKYIESLPAGTVPVEFSYEDQNVRVMGRGIFLLVTRTDPGSSLKCVAVEAMGLEKLNEKLQALDLTKTVNIFIVPAQVNKRTQTRQYLAILVGE